MELQKLTWRSKSLHAFSWACIQLHELAFSYISLHAVTRACMQFLSLSEQLTRISQCLFWEKNYQLRISFKLSLWNLGFFAVVSNFNLLICPLNKKCILLLFSCILLELEMDILWARLHVLTLQKQVEFPFSRPAKQ